MTKAFKFRPSDVGLPTQKIIFDMEGEPTQEFPIGYMAGGGTWGGVGNMMAGRKIFADGGKVHEGAGKVDGPGGPVDDKVPAMLSDGEYVIPADVVKAKGVEFFDKLKAKYHVPASVQRQYGINRG